MKLEAGLVERLREAFERKRYGAGDYDPDFDLFDVAASLIERQSRALVEAREALETSHCVYPTQDMIGCLDITVGKCIAGGYCGCNNETALATITAALTEKDGE